MPGTRPRFSVIVPTHRRDEALARCLASLARLDYGRVEYEVVVVADGQPPESFAAPDGLIARLIVQPRSGPGAARNAGARSARGRWLAFVDDDCRPEAGWLRALERVLESRPGAAVRGRVLNALQRNAYSDATQVVIDKLAATPDYLPTMNFAVDAADFTAIGGFDETFGWAGEDRDFSARWVAAGGEVATADDALVRHAHELGAFSFVGQHFRYGRGAFRYRSAAARRSGRFRLEPASFYVGLVRDAWSRNRAGSPVARAALIAGAQLATAGGFAWEAAATAVRRRD
jgi:GT2 family glycosyltransferase